MTTIRLKKPIKLGDNQPEITELTFREMVAGDLRGIKQDDPMGSSLNLAAKLCGQVPAAMDKLSMPDLKQVMELIESQGGDFL
jgi:Phage tail assembly chaperone proteins, E, or 41 or 14